MTLPIARVLTRTVTYRARTGVSGAGDPTFGSNTEIKAYVESTQKRVLTTNGDETVATHKIVTASEIPKDAQVWLPGDSTANTELTRRVLVTQYAQDPGGFTVWETWV